jgi:hypothetical protein
MKLTINESLLPEAEKLGDQILESIYDSKNVLTGFTLKEHDAAGGIKEDPSILEAFKVGTKYLQRADFGKEILQDFRDDREDAQQFAKEQGETYLMEDFMEDLGYLEGFTGRNLTQLTKYYLSEKAIDDGSWNLEFTVVSDDGDIIAYSFCPLSFREHDGILWYQKVSTGEGICIPFDML